ncbi:potassium transporter Kup [Ferrovibrio sp.]|uniref:potassium transporter Kup n=1 Tax=Ferrovibrio sp. TaxID=1917215 RepID=UPI0025C0E3BD|nr:potassium transporter Kup [Ferrovibrio sp.]MBX3453551.1 potassium transporter Kup [Ferrovibrio sp.]
MTSSGANGVLPQTGTSSPDIAKPNQVATQEHSASGAAHGNGNGNGHGNGHDAGKKAGFWALTLGSIGVVYGDIGTSPLYAFREAMHAANKAHGHVAHGVARFEDVVGVLSLILWALIIIVTLKYVLLLLRADNQGEGGTLSLMALARRALGHNAHRRVGTLMVALGMAGAALFYGDALITPAISVLSAVEGLTLVTTAFDPYVLPLTIVIIVGLFVVQSRGTEKVARFFGPITLVWFVAMAVGGLLHIADHPAVFAAFNPYYAVNFLLHNGHIGLVALGAVFLAVTGAEALYADLGHFGRKPIQFAWSAVVFPALALNYMGQGALVLAKPETLENPFFLLYPDWALLPMVALATMATVIASQAVITGAYSLTRQAIQLRLLPRMEVRHTSESQEGQIYMPQVNFLLLVGVLFLVVLFGSSSKLATAYGIAVTGTMVVTACMAFVVVWKHWHWPLWLSLGLLLPFLAIDFVFLGANLLKFSEGGYVPVLFAMLMMLVMWSWTRGVRIVFDKTRKTDVPLTDLIVSLEKRPPPTVAGTAVFLTSDPLTTPTALLHSLKHYKALHEEVVILTVETANQPRVPIIDRVRMEKLGGRFSRVHLRFGFMEEPNVPAALALCRKLGWKFDIMKTSFFLSRRALRRAAKSEMPAWQDDLFILLANNASDATAYFHIPSGRVVEIGAQLMV